MDIVVRTVREIDNVADCEGVPDLRNVDVTGGEGDGHVDAERVTPFVREAFCEALL